MYTHRNVDWTNSIEKSKYKRMMVNAKDPYFCPCCNKSMVYRNKFLHFKSQKHQWNQAVTDMNLLFDSLA